MLIINVSFFIAIVLIICILTWKSINELKYLYKSILVLLVIFAFLFVTSMVYWMNGVTKVQCDCLFIRKGIAKSAHFATNALIVPSLYDLNNYTGTVLRWIKNTYGETSFTYLITGSTLLFAPLCSAAWLISIFRYGFWQNLVIILSCYKRRTVFLNATSRSVMLAKGLKSIHENESIVFCRYSAPHVILSKEELTEINNMKARCVKGNERDLPFSKKCNAVLCVESVSELRNYLTSTYSFPFTEGKLYVVANESKGYIESYLSPLVKDLVAFSVYERVSKKALDMIQKCEDQCFIVCDGIFAELLGEKLVKMNRQMDFYEKTIGKAYISKINGIDVYSGNLDSIRKTIKSRIDNSGSCNWVFILMENEQDNLELKDYLYNNTSQKIEVVVYCKDMWNRKNEKPNDPKRKCEYIGEEYDVLQDIAVDIESLLNKGANKDA